MLLATARRPAYYGMCSTDVYCSKQTGSSGTEENSHHPSFLRFWNWAEESCRCNKFVAAQKMLLKNRNPANIRKYEDCSVYYCLFILRWKHVCIALLIAWCPSIWATLSAAHCSHTSGFLPVVLHSDRSLSLRVK